MSQTPVRVRVIRPDSAFKAASDYLRSREGQDQQQPKPEVMVGGGVAEGGSAGFTVAASPAPATNLAVSVTVSASGDYGAATGQRTVTVPTTGSATFTVGTVDDSAEEVSVRWYTAPAYHLLDDRAHRSDYQAAEGELVFEPGVTALTGQVWLEQDDEEEPDERFAVEAFLPGSFRVPDAVGTMTIIDDD
ncbi:MAG: hypothetical protein OXP11_03150 [Gammaproteobacteria bacterium]|nr:hypothetical protein [Gammaproteobacteria bacterium]MDE0270181.1 hypothetical protein [Gammaproteobacteria bacterium]